MVESNGRLTRRSSMAVPTGTRLKREDFRRTKHDSAFSQWKILIGPSDWEDHSMAKQGAEKYRTQNIPNWTSCPGVYELGVAASGPRSGRGARKVEPSSVVPVYVGQADNLRTRMQQYGRDGNHLENGCLNNKTATDYETGSSQKGVGLFTDIFSRGLPIVYRCAAVKSKKDAEITERQLLDKFDYAWNNVSNGPRRQDDVHRKLNNMAKQTKFSLLASKFLFVKRKQVGVKIKTCGPSPSKDNGPNSSTTDNNNNNTNFTFFSRIFGLKRLQPTRVQQSGSSGTDNTCGVAIGGGCICTAPPVEGRKRCALHKGMRINGYVSKLDAERKVVVPVVTVVPDQNVVDFQSHDPFVPVCGFIMENGFPCASEPVPRNKRCLEHKGRRIVRKAQPEYVAKSIRTN